MATYYVSGIWTTGANVITDLNIHLVDNTSVHQARKFSLAQAISLVEGGHSVYTANWNYASRGWVRGAIIHVVQQGNYKYLRSNHDRSEKDNLDNMLPMINLGC